MNDPNKGPLDWLTLSNIMESGIPTVHRIAIGTGSRSLDVFVENSGSRVGLQFADETGDALPGSPMSEIVVQRVTREGEPLVLVYTDNTDLKPSFFAFINLVAERMKQSDDSVPVAIWTTLDQWKQLVSSQAILGIEKQHGLWGELWMLDRLIIGSDGDAIHAWTGPFIQPHDFRQGTFEFEVKTTTGNRRIHTINGSEQLVPSPGHTLYIISIRVGKAGSGSGKRLVDWVNSISQKLNGAQSVKFEEGLTGYGYRHEHSPYYHQNLQLASETFMVPVSDDIPRITRANLEKILGNQSHRVSDVHYDLDVEGLGFPDGSDEFLSVLTG